MLKSAYLVVTGIYQNGKLGLDRTRQEHHRPGHPRNIRGQHLTAVMPETTPEFVQHEIDNLLSLDERQLVDKVIGAHPDKTPDLWDAIISPAFRDHAAAILTGELERVTSELDSRDDDEWRPRALNFKTFLNRRVVRFHAAVALTGGEPARPERYALKQLADAVAEHRTAADIEEIDPEDYDLRLWAVLDKIRPAGNTAQDPGSRS